MGGFRFAAKQYLKMFVQRVFLPAIYAMHKNTAIDEQLVLFADSHSDKMPVHMEQLFHTMQAQGYKTVPCISNYGKQGFAASTKQMVAFMKLYAKAKYVFICDYFLPVSSCNKRPETKVIQLWHAGGMLKKFGYDAKDDIPPMYRGSVIRNYDLVTVSAPGCVPVYAGAMGLPLEKVEATGISRSDCFFDPFFLAECKADFYRQYPELEGKRLILWAPTFRGNAGNPKTYGAEAIAALQDQLSDDWFILQKLHPHAEGKPYKSNCTIPTHRLLPLIDLLITDFSTVLFDAALLHKQTVLFAPDYYEYVQERGFYIDYQTDIPYPLVIKDTDLLEAVTKAANTEPDIRTEAFRRDFMGSCDGKATQRIVERITTL